MVLHLATATGTVDVATGAIREHARHTLSEQDHILDAGGAGVVMTTDYGIARLFWREGYAAIRSATAAPTSAVVCTCSPGAATSPVT